jgi:hypothetical protein
VIIPVVVGLGLCFDLGLLRRSFGFMMPGYFIVVVIFLREFIQMNGGQWSVVGGQSFASLLRSSFGGIEKGALASLVATTLRGMAFPLQDSRIFLARSLLPGGYLRSDHL